MHMFNLKTIHFGRFKNRLFLLLATVVIYWSRGRVDFLQMGKTLFKHVKC